MNFLEIVVDPDTGAFPADILATTSIATKTDGVIDAVTKPLTNLMDKKIWHPQASVLTCAAVIGYGCMVYASGQARKNVDVGVGPNALKLF
jgi:hypothetical protein